MKTIQDTLISLVERNAVFFHTWGLLLIISGFVFLLALIYLVNMVITSFRVRLIVTIILIFPLIFLTGLTFLLTSPLNSFITTLATVENSIGKPAPDFEFINLHNNMIYNIHDFRGKVIILNYWRTRCGACENELKELKKIENPESAGLAIISISHDPVDSVRQFIQRGIVPSYTGISSGEAWIDPGTHLPFTIIIDADGIIRKYFYGKENIRDLKKVISKYQSENSHNGS